MPRKSNSKSGAAHGDAAASKPMMGKVVLSTDRIRVERVQTGVRIEKRLLKVLKGLAEYHDITLGDLLEPGEKLMVAQGGWHGLGNTRFKSSTNRAPRQTTPGSEGDRRNLKLELKVLADVGMLGLPNAGKSTFIRAVSAAKPKVANYPFTTLVPNLGVVKVQKYRSFVIADIPGLIEGAAEGHGLGHRFLRHVERTRVLVHMIELAPIDGTDPVEAHASIVQELERYSPALAKKPRITVFSKADMVPDPEQTARELAERIGCQGAYAISGLAGLGVERHLEDCWRLLQQIEDE